MRKAKCMLIGAPCPENSDPKKGNYCPFWADSGNHFVETNTQTGEERIEQCGAKVMVKGQIEVIKASNRPTAAVESVRNEIVNGFSQVGVLLTRIAQGKEAGSKLEDGAKDTKRLKE